MIIIKIFFLLVLIRVLGQNEGTSIKEALS